MASLIEELFGTLEGEKELYEKLIPVSEKKTEILVKDDLKALQKITEEEQSIIEKAAALGKKREKVMDNIGIVLNKDVAALDLATLAGLLDRQPEERKKLVQLHDSLKQIMKRLIQVNEKNKNLIENSLEMIEFNMNFIQSTRMSPGVNNYDKHASSDYSAGYHVGAFDAKQ